MHFICLHGRGTNSKILEMQTAAIRYELGDRNTFDFVEGTVPCEADPNVKSLLTGEDKTWAYFDEADPATALKAVEDLGQFIETNGPYDGVITFSHSSGIAATWILHRLRQGKPIFNCAIYLSASAPAVDYNSLVEGKIVYLPIREMSGAIKIPTAHVWGAEDYFAPAANDLTMLCDPQLRSVYVHDGGHEIPGAGSSEAVTNTVNIIRRATLMARDADGY